MIESDRLTPDALRAALEGFVCGKMLRAWRNRSNCTQWDWVARARALLGTDASLDAIWRLAPALYVACGDLCEPPETFDAALWPPAHWQQLAERLPAMLAYLPEKALQRGAYEARRREKAADSGGLSPIWA